MKLKSVSGITCYVSDLQRTEDFYEMLGFEVRKKEINHVTVYLNWFWIDFWLIDKEDKPAFQKEAKLGNKGSGIFVYISVEDVDEAYKELIEKGLKPSGEPKDWPWGNREFVLRDPDGYKLVFFKRK
jgi:catechol 2,3-dioxygenase-like lactoylglutathione lyase family enzyme